MDALIVVDVQNDFLPTGALPVPRGDEVVPVINALMDRFPIVVATQDWHPPEHGSFAANQPGRKIGDVGELAGLSQVFWPVHCVQGTPGADFAPGLRTERFAAIFRKGLDPRIDSYSGFADNGRRRSTGLAGALRDLGVTRVFVVGLATDYCVKATALDALAAGFEAVCIEDACRGVNLRPGDVDRALEEMRAAGVRVVESREVLAGAVTATAQA
jgi:nicotinamidase/pyrazinamidase